MKVNILYFTFRSIVIVDARNTTLKYPLYTWNFYYFITFIYIDILCPFIPNEFINNIYVNYVNLILFVFRNSQDGSES